MKLNRQNEEIAIKYLEKRRGRGVYEPEKTVSNVLSRFGSQSKASTTKTLRALLDNWTNIVGEKMAVVCTPEAIKGKTLVLSAIGAATPLLQMRSNEIIGLASLACGVNFKKISFIQAKPQRASSKRAFVPIDAAKSKEIEDKIAPIESERLKNAIRMLNTAIENLPK